MSTKMLFRATTALSGVLMAATAAANSTPFIEPLDNITVNAGEQLRLRVVPRDADQVVPGLRLENAPSTAMFSDNGDGSRTFIWTPGNRDSGRRELTFVVFDAQDTSIEASLSIELTINESTDAADAASNLAPEIESLRDMSIQSGESFDFRVVPRDPERLVPALQVDRLPAGASFDDNGDGTRQFRWTPAGNQSVSETLTFTVIDALDSTLSNSTSITLSVAGSDEGARSLLAVRNSRPEFDGLEDQRVSLGNTFEFRVRPQDADGDVPGLAIDRLPPGAAFDDNRDGSRTFRWRPFPINLGDTFVTFTTIDARDPDLRAEQTVRLSVYRDPDNPVNFEPTINGINNPVIRAGDTLNQRVKPVDPDFTAPSLVVLNPPSGADFPDNGDGTRTLRWTTDESDLGANDISFLATDSEDDELQFERTIRVNVIAADSLDRDGQRLRELADQRDFRIGYAAVLQSSMLADNELYGDIAAEEFNIVTPENSHKMGWIQPERGVFEWEDADELADYAETHGMQLHGHPLVWFAQLPGWVQQLQPADAQAVMREHISALTSRYRGRVAVWDVVNEALEEDGSLRESIWYQGMGEAYIRDAFETARSNDPAAVLIYNDYDVVWENTKSDAMYELMKKELAAGTPIDGVGFQMHLRSGFDDFDSVVANLQRFADLGLDIYITEFDVAIDAPDTEQTQADVYRRSLEICLNQPACRAMQSWGFTDRYSWRSGFSPLMFDSAYQIKPAYTAWQDTLRDF